MTKVTRTVGVDPYHDTFLQLLDRVNAAGLLRDAIDREIQRTDSSPRQIKRHVQAIQDHDDHSIDTILEQAHNLDEFFELSPNPTQQDPHQ